MLAPPLAEPSVRQRIQLGPLPEELEFYGAYDWCLNPYVTVADAIHHLHQELRTLPTSAAPWQVAETVNNVFLLGCGLLNCIDEHLRGRTLRMPSRLAATAAGRGLVRLAEIGLHRRQSRRCVDRWRDQLLSGLNDFLLLLVRRRSPDAIGLIESGRKLRALSATVLPADLRARRMGTPSPFRQLDLTPQDVLQLGDCFVRRFPDRTQPVLLMGLRTSGSYFAPLLRAFLASEGYSRVQLLTVEPIRGVGRSEAKTLKRLAALGYWALIVDDPPKTSRTMLAALAFAQRAGFAPASVKFVAPTHSANPSWFETLPPDSVVTFPARQWHKVRLLSEPVAERQIAEYFRQDFARVSIVADGRAVDFNDALHASISDERGRRLKRVFEVELQTPDGEQQTTYVLAKSVGWGWLGYHAFLIGQRLSGHVPPLLGLRDGILYQEWIPQPESGFAGEHDKLVDASAAYTAARVRRVNLSGSVASMESKKHNAGSELLVKTLGRAYGRLLPERMMRPHIGRMLQARRCPVPTVIDGNMGRSEWVLGPRGPLKTDFEHHGLGKNTLDVVDPAYDLADAILKFELAPDAECKLVQAYIDQSGDAGVRQRLFMHKLLAGLAAMSQAQDQLLASPHGAKVQYELHRRFMSAWNFLTVQTARQCGSLCHPRAQLHWRSPLVVLDVDGVIDRRLFGYPSTTAAGIEALSLLSAHDVAVALNTARSASEVQDYCAAYGLAGGVAEYGSYLWDAVHRRERVLIDAQAKRQLAELRRNLQRLPGVFLDERHRCSIRALTYRDKPQGILQDLTNFAGASNIGDGALAPLPKHLIDRLLVDLRLDRLAYHQTMIDTTILAKGADKGTGLAALRDWVLRPDVETIAVGDQEADLSMFGVATRSFAPANVGCRRQAQLLGCRISSYAFQRGLLDIVRSIVHPDNARRERCNAALRAASLEQPLFLAALQAADRPWRVNLIKALFSPRWFNIFLR